MSAPNREKLKAQWEIIKLGETERPVFSELPEQIERLCDWSARGRCKWFSYFPKSWGWWKRLGEPLLRPARSYLIQKGDKVAVYRCEICNSMLNYFWDEEDGLWMDGDALRRRQWVREFQHLTTDWTEEDWKNWNAENDRQLEVRRDCCPEPGEARLLGSKHRKVNVWKECSDVRYRTYAIAVGLLLVLALNWG